MFTNGLDEEFDLFEQWKIKFLLIIIIHILLFFLNLNQLKRTI
jgi:hypothetical protein